MPTVEPSANAKVLVSGANGYIAMWVVQTLLEQGYTVRGTVRSAEKGQRLQEYFHPYGDKVEWVIVEDIMKDGAFDEAVKDVDAIEHMASPLTSTTGDPDEYLKPAVHGTVGILKSAYKFGNRVKRVVITSSCASIISDSNSKEYPVTLDETRWGDESVKIVMEQGANAPEGFKYRASKTLAEKAAWDFYKECQSEIKWDLVALNPSVVIGPSLHELKRPTDLTFSVGVFYNNLVTEKPDDVLQTSYSYIHVYDIAVVHVAALRHEAAGGQRIIVAEGSVTWQETRNLIHSIRPDLYASGVLPRGNPDLPSTVQYIFSSAKGKKIFGLKYKDLKEIVSETLADFEEHGWLVNKG